jgi:hypothetical protein
MALARVHRVHPDFPQSAANKRTRQPRGSLRARSLPLNLSPRSGAWLERPADTVGVLNSGNSKPPASGVRRPFLSRRGGIDESGLRIFRALQTRPMLLLRIIVVLSGPRTTRQADDGHSTTCPLRARELSAETFIQAHASIHRSTDSSGESCHD